MTKQSPNGVVTPEPAPELNEQPSAEQPTETPTDPIAALLVSLQQQRQHTLAQIERIDGALQRLQNERAELLRQFDRCDGAVAALTTAQEQTAQTSDGA